MTVKELKVLLSGYEDDREVIISKDEEGNGFSPLESANAGRYLPYNSYSGEPCADDDQMETSVAAVFLWPTN